MALTWLLQVGLSLEIIGAVLLSLDVFNQQVRTQIERASRLLVKTWYTTVSKGSTGAIWLAPILFLSGGAIAGYLFFTPRQSMRLRRNPELLSNHGIPSIALDPFIIYYDSLNRLYILSPLDLPIYPDISWNILADMARWFSLFGEFFVILPYFMIISPITKVIIGGLLHPSAEWNELETIHMKIWYVLTYLIQESWSVLLIVSFFPLFVSMLALSVVVLLPVLPVLFGFELERDEIVSSGLRFSGLLYLTVGFIIQFLSTFI